MNWWDDFKNKVEDRLIDWQYSYVVTIEHATTQPVTQIWEWLKEEVGRENYHFRWRLHTIETIEYRFRHREHALLFALRWQ